jgi:phosphoglycolate phosphatase
MHVLLDLDGTLTDPREGIVGCIKHALNGLGHPCPTDKELERYIGPPLQVTFGAAFGAGSPRIAEAIALYRERFAVTGLFENEVYPGIPEVLARLKQLGATLLIATSKPTVFAARIVEHFGIGEHIDEVFGSELDGTRSDKAELIAHILKAHAIDPAAACMVGDREFDMRGAAANKVRAIGALWGYGSREELLQSGAAALCEAPAQLPKAVMAVA